MNRPGGDVNLSSEEQTKLQSLVSRFEKTGTHSGTIDLGNFLPPPGDRLRPAALRELIKNDLTYRWQKGSRTFLEAYLQQYPELRNDSESLVALLIEEFSARGQQGDKPVLASYKERFPGQFAALEKLVWGHDSPTSPAAPILVPTNLPSGEQPTGRIPQGPGGYTLIKRLGSGSFGEVWQAEAPGGIEAAVKIIFRSLTHSESQRELQSLELMKRMRHPFLLQTQAFWSLEDRLMIAMELADGSLRDRMQECVAAGHNGIPVEELMGYTREASEALDYLHSKQVLHRDIKPDNILLLGHHAKLADFGLARLLQAQMAKMTVTGTPAFMPPESWSGQAGEKSDQYALAGSYVEMRLNRHLFPSRDMAGAMLDHLNKTPELAELPEPEQAVLQRALAKKLDDRYSTCMEFYEALRSAIGLDPHGPFSSPSGAFGKYPSSAGGQSSSGRHGTMKFGSDSGAGSPLSTLDNRAGHTAHVDREPQRQRRRFAAMAWALALILLVSAFGVGAALWNRSQNGEGSGGGENPPEVYLPKGFQKAADANVTSVGERKVYDRIAYAYPDKTELVFVLIPKNRASDPEPYYMLRDKITNHDFAQFARDHADAVRNSSWELGPEGPNAIALGAGDYPFYPVMRVSVDDAQRFARALNGQMPTAQQWDKAAGRFDGAIGPFLGDGQGLRHENSGVGLNKLLSGNRESPTATIFGCRDMAGNGYEWTSSQRDDESKTVPFDNPNWNERISVRGQTYFAGRPFHFADRPNSRYRFQDPQGEPGASAVVGFRVAVPLEPN